MAKIKLRFGENEIEIDSRDFYIDNETLGDVIRSVSKHIRENKTRIVFEDQPTQNLVENTLDSLEDAEFHEPEFNPPRAITVREIKNKLTILEKNSFFDTPRTTSETVEQLREHGWSAGPLEVSKVLTQMAFYRELSKKSTKNKTFYSKRQTIIAN